jgi:hypothetical protein
MKELLEELGFKDENGVYLPMLSAFVIGIGGDSECSFPMKYAKIKEYCVLITQPLTKGMFVPCDLDGNELEEPIPASFETSQQYRHLQMLYQQAKERVLFEGWKYEVDSWGFNLLLSKKHKIEVNKSGIFNDGLNTFEAIEQLINNGVKLYLK